MPCAVLVPGAVARVESDRLPRRSDGVRRKAEVEQLDTRRREHHIPRLQIPMDDAEPVGGFERVGDLGAEAEDLRRRQRAAGQTGRQCLALEQFEHEVVDVMRPANVVQTADVRVVERGNGFGLAGEARAEVGVGRQLRCEDLHRDTAIQPRVPRPIHFAHPSRTDQGEQFIRTEVRTRLEGHLVAAQLCPRRVADAQVLGQRRRMLAAVEMDGPEARSPPPSKAGCTPHLGQ